MKVLVTLVLFLSFLCTLTLTLNVYAQTNSSLPNTLNCKVVSILFVGERRQGEEQALLADHISFSGISSNGSNISFSGIGRFEGADGGYVSLEGNQVVLRLWGSEANTSVYFNKDQMSELANGRISTISGTTDEGYDWDKHYTDAKRAIECTL
ncbi:MAG: hypothetical protein HQK49_09745 [Oligoflexia bacterium]|nr:hypothetical protein [Oligoflexia bacterium]